MKLMIKYCFVLIALFCICSCASYKEVPYFQNSRTVDLSNSKQQFDLVIQPKGKLNIFVYSSVNKEFVAFFNIRERSGIKPGQKLGDASNQSGFYRYLVDKEGNIEFPEVGKIHLSGLTIEQASAAVKEALKPLFKDDNSYMVNTYMLNYYVSVLGEVQKPGSFSVERNRMTVWRHWLKLAI